MDQITELVRRVLEGDTQAFEIIYQNTYRQIYYTCMSFLKNEQNVYDVMQDTYITALTHLQQLQNPERLVPWLNQIAVNRCRDYLRKKQPVQLEDELAGTELMEENENFLPESYVINEEKRKQLLNIMQEELSAVQYQTIILYYFDGMNVSEIAELMQCPEGTVTYRLSTARGRIKKGVQAYEDISGQKLYSSGGITLLTAVFYAETQNLVIPNVLTKIFATMFGGAAGAAVSSAAAAVGATAATTTGAVEMSAAGTVTTGTAGTAVGTAAGKTAAKAGVKALLGTTKAKVATGIVAAAVVTGGVAGAVLLNNDKTDTGDHYKEVDYELVDDDYLNVTITRIYDKGYIPDECRNYRNQTLDETYWSANDCIVQYEVKNKTQENVYLDIRFMTGNNEAFDYDSEVSTTWCINPGQEAVSYMNNHSVGSDIDVGRDPLEWVKAEAVVYVEGGNAAEWKVVDYVLEDIDFYGNGMDKTYKRTVSDDREQVVVDNDDIKVTFVGAQSRGRLLFYVENKSGQDIKVRMYSDYVSEASLDMPAGTSGYISTFARSSDSYEKSDLVNAAMDEGGSMPLMIFVEDYSQAGGHYVNYRSFYKEPDFDSEILGNGVAYGWDLQEKMQATRREYDGEFSYFEIKDKKQ